MEHQKRADTAGGFVNNSRAPVSVQAMQPQPITPPVGTVPTGPTTQRPTAYLNRTSVLEYEEGMIAGISPMFEQVTPGMYTTSGPSVMSPTSLGSYGFTEYRQISLPSSVSALPSKEVSNLKTRTYTTPVGSLNSHQQSAATTVMGAKVQRSGSIPLIVTHPDEPSIGTVQRRASNITVSHDVSQRYPMSPNTVHGIPSIALPSAPIVNTTNTASSSVTNMNNNNMNFGNHNMTAPRPPIEPQTNVYKQTRRAAPGHAHSMQASPMKPPELSLPALPPPPILVQSSQHSVATTSAAPSYIRHNSIPCNSLDYSLTGNTALQSSSVSQRPTRTLSAIEQSPLYTSYDFPPNTHTPTPLNTQLASTPSPQNQISSYHSVTPQKSPRITYPSSVCPTTSSNNITVDGPSSSPVNVTITNAMILGLPNYNLDMIHEIPVGFPCSDISFPSMEPCVRGVPVCIFRNHVLILKLLPHNKNTAFWNAAQICSIIANDDVKSLTAFMELGQRADTKFAQIQYKIPYRSIASVRCDALYKELDRSGYQGPRRNSTLSLCGDQTWFESDLSTTQGDDGYNNQSHRRSFVSSNNTSSSDVNSRIVSAMKHPWRVVSPTVSPVLLAVMWNAPQCLKKQLTLVPLSFINNPDKPLLFQFTQYNNAIDDTEDAFDHEFVCSQVSEPQEVFRRAASGMDPESSPYPLAFTQLTFQSKRAMMQDILVKGGASLMQTTKYRSMLGLQSSLGDYKLTHFMLTNYNYAINADHSTNSPSSTLKDSLHIAVRNVDPRMAAVLLHFMYNVDALNNHSNTPLQCCVALAECEPCSHLLECRFHRCLLMARVLLFYNADCATSMCQNGKEYKLTDIALSVGNQSMFSLLVASGCYGTKDMSYKASENQYLLGLQHGVDAVDTELRSGNASTRKGGVSLGGTGAKVKTAVDPINRSYTPTQPGVAPVVSSRMNKMVPPLQGSSLLASSSFSVASDTPSYSARSSKVHSPLPNQRLRGRDDKNQTLAPSTYLTASVSSHTIVTGSQSDLQKAIPSKEKTKRVKDNKESKRDKKEKKDKKDKRHREGNIIPLDSPMFGADGKSPNSDSRPATSHSHRPNSNASMGVQPLQSTDNGIPGSPTMQSLNVGTSPNLHANVSTAPESNVVDDFAYEYPEHEFSREGNERFQPHPGMDRTLDPRAGTTRKLNKTILVAPAPEKSTTANSPALRSKMKPRRGSVDGGDL